MRSESERIAVLRATDYERGALEPPFRPSGEYPEVAQVPRGSTPNTTYAMVRALLALWAGEDPDRIGAGFSPFAGRVEPGMRVLVKPNLVIHQHPDGDEGLRASVTDAAVMRPVLDYVALALGGEGTITVAESPIRMTDFDSIVRWTGLDRVLDDVASTWGVTTELIDIRDQTVRDAATFKDDLRVKHQPGDPRGSVRVDLGPGSALEELGDTIARLRSTAAVGRNEVGREHLPGKHVYELSRSVLDADLIIGMPKLKTHKKVGMTCGMKNFVGTIVRKEWLPHHRHGPPSQGGDEFAEDTNFSTRMREKAKDAQLQTPLGARLLGPARRLYKQRIRGTFLDPFSGSRGNTTINGAWSGNDTCWRMVHDVYRAILYARTDGTLADTPVRRVVTIVDGLIAGEGDGPLWPQAKPAGLMLMGDDAAWVDHTAARLMGYDPLDIPMLAQVITPGGKRPLTLNQRSQLDLRCLPAGLAAELLSGSLAGAPFVPPAGWAIHLCDEEMLRVAQSRQRSAGADY